MRTSKGPAFGEISPVSTYRFVESICINQSARTRLPVLMIRLQRIRINNIIVFL